MIGAAIAELGRPCPVVATRPDVPVEGMEEALGQPVHWLEDGKPAAWHELGLDPPSIFFQSGWAEPAFSSLAQQVRRAGGKVVLLMDNNWLGHFRQRVLGAAAFRTIHRNRYDAALVPGKAASRLAAHYGFPRDRIHMGMYGADPAIFAPQAPLAERPKEFLFVGQFIHRKGVLDLCEAFLAHPELASEFRLRLCGSGELRSALPRHQSIVIEDFVQPQELARRYNAARALVLPSREEHWGLVVHEAALCGCGLILSDAVGSAPDLATPDNSLIFGAGDKDALGAALVKASRWSGTELERIQQASLRIAGEFGPARFARGVKLLVSEFENLGRSDLVHARRG